MFRDKNTVRFHLAMWVGHWAPLIVIGAMVYFLGTAIYGRIDEDSFLDSPFSAAFSLTLSVVMVFALFAEAVVHDTNLCAKDIDQAPLSNPQDAVDRNLRYLRMRHTLRPALWAGAALVSWIGLGIVSLRWENFLSVTAYAAASVWMLISTGTLSYSRLVHRRLGPWCPWCRWGRGPDDDDDPPPAPTGPTSDARTDAN